MPLSQTTLSQPATPLKQHAGFGILLFLILSLLFVLFINTAYAGRYYVTNAGTSFYYDATPEGACQKFVTTKYNSGSAQTLRRKFRYTSISPSLLGSAELPYRCNFEYSLWLHSKEILKKELYVIIAFHDTSCPSNLTENGTGSCVTPTAYPKQGNSCSTNSSPNPILGNPIIVATGNKFQPEVDYQSQSPFGLSFVRYYNSTGYNVTTDIGIKWRHNGNNRLAVNSTTEVLMYRNTGQVFTFNYNGTHWQGDVDIPDTLVELTDASHHRTGWRYTTSNDTVELYNLSGQLLSISNRQGQTNVFSYDITVADGGDDDNSTLDKVTGFNGDVMSFTYDSNPFVKRITSMTSPEGNTYLYSYDALGNLQTVTYPDNTPNDSNDNPTRRYHYENTTFPHHLTGITDETGVRYATWHYDSQGRAISSEHTGGVDIGTLSYNADGSVTTTDTLGKQTTYHFTTLHGVKKVTQVEGHASQSCVAANKNYTYDINGYLASKTDWQGKVTTYVHNARGLETSRTEAFGTAEARTITTDWHATYRLPIKITEPGKVTDYSYDAQGRLTSQTSHTP